MMSGQIAKLGNSAAQFLLGGLAALRSFGSGEKAKAARGEDSRQDTDLRDAMKQWREVFEHNPVMYFMVDPTGTVLNVNTFGAAQLGYTTAELIGQSVLNVFFEEDHDTVRHCVALCLETVDQPHTWEIRKIRKDGSVLWVRENAKAMLRGDGRPIVLVACENITQRKEAEDALRRSEAYLAHAQELSHTGSFGLSLVTGEAVWSRRPFASSNVTRRRSRPLTSSFSASIRTIATGSDGPLIGLPSKRRISTTNIAC